MLKRKMFFYVLKNVARRPEKSEVYKGRAANSRRRGAGKRIFNNGHSA